MSVPNSQLSTFNSRLSAFGFHPPTAPAQAAETGLAGEVVQALTPHTEADPVALLLSLLVAFGNLVGHGPHFTADASQHHLNLYCVLVGPSADSRKGTSWAQIRRLFELVDPEWMGTCLRHGLTSGEGLLYALRDQAMRQHWTRYGHNPPLDPGVDEKRLLLVEEDFAPALRRLARRGSTLSAMLRSAWDKGELQLMIKSRSTRATGAQLSLIGHLTPEELRSCLPPSEIAGGFANRFLWACVSRSRYLPEGEPLEVPYLRAFAKRIAEAAATAREAGRLSRDPAASLLWRETYPALSLPRRDPLDAVLARSAPQVMRLACLYALLDRTPQVQRPHLEAALALWRYCQDCALALFTEPPAPTLADRLLSALQQSDEGLTRHDIDHLLAHHRTAATVTAALHSLAAQGLAASRKEGNGRGRPTERWFAVSQGDRS